MWHSLILQDYFECALFGCVSKHLVSLPRSLLLLRRKFVTRLKLHENMYLCAGPYVTLSRLCHLKLEYGNSRKNSLTAVTMSER